MEQQFKITAHNFWMFMSPGDTTFAWYVYGCCVRLLGLIPG